MKGAIKAPSVRSTRAEEAKWQAEDDVRTLMRAQEIQADRARMARAAQIAKQKAAEASRIATMASKAKPAPMKGGKK